MRFRKALRRVLQGLWPSRFGRAIPNLVDADVLCRYLFQSKEFSREKRIVKRFAFMPARDGATSVYHTTGLSTEEISELSRIHVEPERQKAAYGWAEIQVEAVRAVHLELDYNNDPPRHINLTGWPDEKDHQISIAQQLAASASLVLRQTAATDTSQ